MKIAGRYIWPVMREFEAFLSSLSLSLSFSPFPQELLIVIKCKSRHNACYDFRKQLHIEPGKIFHAIIKPV
jgi:hypothetical protein